MLSEEFIQTFRVETALQKYPIGQRRTSKNKPFTFLLEDVAIKGPYPPQGTRIQNILTRSNLLTSWGTPGIVHPIETFETEEGIFVVFPNLAKGYPRETEPYEEKTTGWKYQVILRQGLIQLHRALEQEGTEWIWDHTWDLLKAYLHLFVLSVGDVGFWNALADLSKEKIFIIDYEDSRMSIKESPAFYFNKKSRGEDLWLKHALPFYLPAVDELQKLEKIAPLFTDRIAQAKEWLRKYAPQEVSIEEHIFEEIPSEHILEEKMEEIPQGISKEIPKGKMVFKGIFGGSTTFSGYPLDIMKSALQKYIRRGKTDKALIAGMELVRMAEFPQGKGIRTNALNRLAIIAVEDIGPAHLPLVVTVVQRMMGKTVPSPAEIAALIQWMAASEKTRIMSHAWRTFATPVGREVALSYGIEIPTGLEPKDEEYLQRKDVPGSHVFLPQDPKSLKPYALMFYKELMEGNYKAVGWVYLFLKAARVGTSEALSVPRSKKRYNISHPMAILWKMLEDFVDARVVQTLAPIYFKRKTDRNPFFMTALMASLFQTPYTPLNIQPWVKWWESQPKLKRLLHGQYHFEIDPYVIDQHTALGRRRGMGRKEFVQQGALVQNPSPIYFNELLEKVYQEILE